jgi:hypothetical protein
MVHPIFCTSVLEFYELLNETMFKSLGTGYFVYFVLLMILIWVHKTVLPPNGKIWTKDKKGGKFHGQSSAHCPLYAVYAYFAFYLDRFWTSFCHQICLVVVVR